MPIVTFDGQSFLIDGRRFWVLGASIPYARVPSELWAQRIAAAKQAGFNTIQTACPWMIHEPRPGRFDFEGDADVRNFIELCHAAGMKVILLAGPSIGDGYDGGGIPPWLLDGQLGERMRLREANEPFLERVSLYFRKLFAELSEMDAAHGGPILLVQAEHAWLCSNPEQGQRYLREIARMIRELGFEVPITGANDLWQDVPGTIETWRGWDDLLVHLRQLRTVQSDSPRLVSAFNVAQPLVWGRPAPQARTPAALMHRLAQVFAAGAQTVVHPFHAGTNFGFLAGRIPGEVGGFSCTRAANVAPVDEAGRRGPNYHAVKRLIMFAHHFNHVLAELNPDDHPVVLDLNHPPSRDRGRSAMSVVPLRGSGGRIVFVFADDDDSSSGDRTAMLILEDGVRMPVDLGDQPVGWYLFDVDLAGSGRLDYANLCPWAIVDRSIVVLYGPAKMTAYVSIGGNPLQAVVPPTGSAKPLVLQHKSVTLVICNQQQIDAAYHDGQTLYVGADGLALDGRAIPARGQARACIIRKNDVVAMRAVDGIPDGAAANGARSARAPALGAWTALATDEFVHGRSPRFASLDGPASLSACGSPLGYGWYRIQLKSASARTCLVHWPQAGDRVNLFQDGRLVRLFGDGPGADSGPFNLRLASGEQTIVALAQNFGRFCDGNDQDLRQGLYGHLYHVKPLRAAKARKISAEPVNPFAIRGFIAGRTFGQLSDVAQLAWSFTHTKKNPILVDARGWATGTFVLNDKPVAYYSGSTGAGRAAIVLDPATQRAFKRGKNVLRFAPDVGQAGACDQMARGVAIHECLAALTEGATWSFARWDQPSPSAFGDSSRRRSGESSRPVRGLPCWWRTTFQPLDARQDLWFDAAGLSKGQLFVNGRNAGRFFTATASGKPVGPQTSLFIPWPWIIPGRDNVLLVFDEHGFDPRRARLRTEG